MYLHMYVGHRPEQYIHAVHMYVATQARGHSPPPPPEHGHYGMVLLRYRCGLTSLLGGVVQGCPSHFPLSARSYCMLQVVCGGCKTDIDQDGRHFFAVVARRPSS